MPRDSETTLPIQPLGSLEDIYTAVGVTGSSVGEAMRDYLDELLERTTTPEPACCEETPVPNVRSGIGISLSEQVQEQMSRELQMQQVAMERQVYANMAEMSQPVFSSRVYGNFTPDTTGCIPPDTTTAIPPSAYYTFDTNRVARRMTPDVTWQDESISEPLSRAYQAVSDRYGVQYDASEWHLDTPTGFRINNRSIQVLEIFLSKLRKDKVRCDFLNMLENKCTFFDEPTEYKLVDKEGKDVWACKGCESCNRLLQTTEDR
jgi:hypothetical protein